MIAVQEKPGLLTQLLQRGITDAANNWEADYKGRGQAKEANQNVNDYRLNNVNTAQGIAQQMQGIDASNPTGQGQLAALQARLQTYDPSAPVVNAKNLSSVLDYYNKQKQYYGNYNQANQGKTWTSGQFVNSNQYTANAPTFTIGGNT